MPEAYVATHLQTPRLKVGQATIGWAVVGASSRAQQFVIEAIRSQPAAPHASDQLGAWVAGVYSHHEQRARSFAQQNQLPLTFVNLTDLLERPNIHCLYVSSHPRHHYPLVMAALSAGKHVLCEPPLGLTVAEAQAMCEAAARRKVLLGVHYQRRADPAIQAARTLLTDGAIGDLLGARVVNTPLLQPHQQTWRLKRNGGGVLLSRTSHDLDTLRYLLQDEVAEIFATQTPAILSEESGGVEENILAIAQMQRSRLAVHLHDSFFIPHQPTLIELYGSTGILQIQHWADDQQESRLLLLRNGQTESFTLAHHHSPDWRLIYAFNQALRAGAPLLADATDGRNALAAVLAAQKSLWSRRPEAPEG
ncbi:MAG: gfo/Idh/MocA family oxidoreductase [Caldilinea sp. CFX5]|nr:gfo/Idh/MocA family oxidoreductase [Caldilinea sp. CFX5]